MLFLLIIAHLMARITVEDCLEKIDSQYDLVLLAKERTAQLNVGDQALVPTDNDKNTVIALREIGEGKITVKSLEDAAINKLRKQQEETTELEELNEEYEDDFDKVYKGEISKSGTAILPSKRTRRIPEKVNLDFKKQIEKSEEKTIDQKATEDKSETEDKSAIENKNNEIDSSEEDEEQRSIESVSFISEPTRKKTVKNT